MLTPGFAPTALVGMKLKAWAFFTAAGAVIRGEGVSIAQTAPGTYTATFTTPSNTAYVGIGRISDTTYVVSIDSVSAASCRVVLLRLSDNSQVDRGNVHVAFYE